MAQGLTRKQFEREMAELAQSVSGMQPLPAEGRDARVRRAEYDKEYFSRTYFPEYVPFAFTDDHRAMFAHCDDTETPHLEAGYRGLGKSVVISFLDVMHKILYKLRHFILTCSETDDKATQEFVGPLSVYLAHDPRIRQDFGDLKTFGSWEYGDFTTTTGIRVKAISWRMSPRSLRNGPYRPDHVIFEDIENPRQGDSPRIIDRKTKAITTDFLGAAELTNFSAVFVANYVRKPSVTHNLIQNEEFASHIYPLLDEWPITEETQSRWPEKYPLPVVFKILRKLGTPAFLREMMQRPDSDGTYFQDAWRTFYDPEDVRWSRLQYFCWGDPRKSDNIKSGGSDDALVVIGIDEEWQKIYVIFAWARKESALGFVNKQYEVWSRWKPVMGVESNVGGKFLKQTYTQAAQQKGFTLPIHYHEQSQNKEDRIKGKSVYVENEQVLFREGDPEQERLWEQLKDTPDWADGNDLADCLAGAIELYEWFQGGGNDVESWLI